MSKAEERACQYTGYCRNQSYKDYLNGYHQAEKDNKLTWEDIGTIDQLLWDLAGEHRLDNEGYYKAVLSRFKAQKKV